MSLKPLEDYAYALKTTIEAYAGAALTAIQGEAGDGIVLKDFMKVEVGYNNIFGQRAYPVCFLYPSRAAYEASAIEAELVTFKIEVWFAVTASQAETLTKKIMRYADALRTVVFENSTLGGVVIDATTEETEFWPGGPDNSGIAAGKVMVSIVSELRN